jgi:DNA-binding transcriptional MerR regulator
MDPKMPSLFDDDFFEDNEKETSKVPVVKSNPDRKTAGEGEQNTLQKKDKKETTTQEAATSSPGDIKVENQGPQTETPEIKAAEPEQEKELPPAAEAKAARAVPGPIMLGKPTLELPGSKPPDNLDGQLLAEIVQTDYAALIPRDFPFAPENIEVVHRGPKKKELPKVSPAANASPAPPADEAEEKTAEGEEAALPEWDLKKNYYTIGEVARLFGVNISHIRFWTNEFKLKPRTNRKGDRLYAPGQIAELRLIHYLVKVKKHTLKGAREKLKTQKTTLGQNLELKDSLVQLRDTLLQIKDSLS